MTRPATSRFLHVANGSCTTRLIEAAGIPGALSIWADPLHDGPVPGGLTDGELLDLRARHLAGPAGQAHAGNPVNDMGQWRAAIDDHGAYDELILWFEHDLFDQLNLIQLLSWIRTRVPAAKTVSLVCIGAFPGHPRFKGLGELTAEELASLLDTRQRVSQAQYDLAGVAWHAFRAPTPEPLDGLRDVNSAALPYLAPALARFLQEYPWTTDGLSRTERRLLKLASAGNVELSAAFPRMHDDEETYYIADTSIAELADALSQTAPPLLTLAPGQIANGGWLQGAMTLTETGLAVLEGRQDRVAACGIDRWLGGVHLHGDASPWRWDNTHQRITR